MREITFARAAQKYLARMPKKQAQRVLSDLNKLARDRERQGVDVEPLRGRDGYRLRVGRYRALFEQDDQEIRVVDVAPRGGAYK